MMRASSERRERMERTLEILEDLPEPVIREEDIPSQESLDRMREAQRKRRAWRTTDH